MAVIPQYQRQVAIEPTQRPGRNPAAMGAAAGQLAETAGRTANILDAFATAERRARDADAASNAIVEYTRGLSALDEEAQRSDLRDSASARAWFQQRSNALLTDIQQRAGLSAEGMRAWRQDANRLTIAREEGVAREAFQRGQQASIAGAQTQLEEFGNQAGAARSPTERQTFLEMGERRVAELEEAGVINPLQARGLRDRFQTSVSLGTVRMAMARGDLGGAMAMVNDPARTPGLDADRRASMVMQIQSAQQAAAARAEASLARQERMIDRALTEFNGLLSQGIVPADRAEQVLRMARGTPMEAQAQRLFNDARLVSEFTLAAPARQAEMLAEADARRRAPNASDVDQAHFARLSQVRTALNRAYEENGIGASVALGVVQPLPALNWNDPASLAARVDAAAGETQRLGRRVSPFTRDDLVSGVEQFVQAAPEQRLSIIQALGSMGNPAERARVIAEFERARGDAGRMPAGSVMRIFEMMQAGTPQAMLSARRLVADLGADVSDRVRAAGERPELNSALETAGGRGVQAVLREQARIAGGGVYASALDLDMSLIRRSAAVRMAAGESPSEAIAAAQRAVSAARTPLRLSGLAEVVLPANVQPARELEAGFRALRERAATVNVAPADGGAANQSARDMRAAAQSAVWINAGSGFALVVPGIPAPLARATLDDVRAAGTQAALPPIAPRPAGQQRQGRMLPTAPTDTPELR